MDKSKFAVETYNKIADKYTQQYFHDLTDSPYIDKFISMIDPKGKILDVGCGPGNFTKYISDKGYSVKGIDLSEEMIKIAQEKVPECNFQVMDMRHLDFPSESFDGLLVAYSLIHIASEEILKTLQEFYRILKPEGIILLITQSGEEDKIVDEPLLEGEKTFINFFTPERIANYLKQAGLSVIYQEEKASQDSESLSDKVIYTITRKSTKHE